MNDNNNSSNGGIRPYKASGNLNTVIGNPSVNINDTMNVNIQSMSTNNFNNTNNNFQNMQDDVNTSFVQNINQKIVNNTPVNDTNNNNNTEVNNISNNVSTTKPNNSYVTKTYVGLNSKPPKKNNNLKIGPELKIALLIIVILMVFIFLLPKISEIFRGY